jgi:thiol-disulfide isomerase/thioredoxin
MKNKAPDERKKSNAVARHFLPFAFCLLTLAAVALASFNAARVPSKANGPPEVNAARLAKIRQEHLGKVVLVDFWATWCEPCTKFFPHSAQLQKRQGPQGLQVITVSLDDAEQAADVADFLAHHPAPGMLNYRSRSAAGSETVSDFEIRGGAIPHLKLYDRHGKLRKTFGSGGQPLSDIDQAVEQLLRET